jgi:uncharacterized protein YlxP (DUF503 family)
MIVAALRFTFNCGPDQSSHRREAQKIKDRLWSHFKVAVAEIPSHSPMEIKIAASFVGSNEKVVQERCAEIIRHLNDWANVELTYDEQEVIHFDDLELERDILKYDP